jgi:peptidoglycan/LPS O-acetylase OafA/YrhL
MRQGYIPTLNGWRAIAVLLVIGAHSFVMLFNSGTWLGRFVASILSHAGIGVDIFFAISGFLICTLLLREKDTTGTIDLRSFYIRRFFRIVPPMWVYLLVLSWLSTAGILHIHGHDLISAALFFKNYVPYGGWYADHFWSLAVEEHFYLFVPLLLLCLPWRSAVMAAVFLVACCTIVRELEFHVSPAKVEFHTEARLDAIMYGAFWALLCFRVPNTLRQLLRGPLVVLLLVSALFLCAFGDMPLHRTLMAATIPLPIVWTVLNADSIIARALECSPLQWVGKLSYSIYVWQMIFLVPGDRPLGVFQGFPAAFAGILACSILSHWLVERPMIRLGQRLAIRHDSSISIDQKAAHPAAELPALNLTG